MSKWTVDGTTIKKDGAAIFLAGVDYSPTPAGAATFKPAKGDWFAPPWDAIWERDFRLMQQMGLNNLRTYFFWAWFAPDAEGMRNWRNLVSGPPDLDHTPFLDAAAAAGIYVTIGIALDGGEVFNNGDPKLGKDFLSFYTATAEKLAEQYGNHEAVMGFCLANEQNQPPRIRRADYWDAFEQMARAVKAKAPDKLVTQAMQNDSDPSTGMFTATITRTQTTVPQRYKQIFDYWSDNIYAGMGTTLDDYRRLVVANDDTRLPLVVSEWGVGGGKNVPDGAQGPPAGNATAREYTQEEFTAMISGRMASDVEAMKRNRDFVSGAQYMAWSDEWWKNEHTPVWEQNASGSPDWPEEFWGLYGIAPTGRTAQDGPWNQSANAPYPPDTLTARPTVAALSKMYKELAAAG